METNEPFWQRGEERAGGGIRHKGCVCGAGSHFWKRVTKPHSVSIIHRVSQHQKGEKSSLSFILLREKKAKEKRGFLFFLVEPHMLNGNGAGVEAGVPCDARCNEFTLPFSKSALPFLTALTSSRFVAPSPTGDDGNIFARVLALGGRLFPTYPQMV